MTCHCAGEVTRKPSRGRPGSLKKGKNTLMPHHNLKLSTRSYLCIGSLQGSTEAGLSLTGLDPLQTGRLFTGVASALRRTPTPSLEWPTGSGPPWHCVREISRPQAARKSPRLCASRWNRYHAVLVVSFKVPLPVRKSAVLGHVADWGHRSHWTRP